MRKTKIVATLGPASDTEEKITALIEAGMNVARLNFSHGTHDYHAELIARVRRVAARVGRPVAVLQDLQGPKVRVGTFVDNKPVELVPGAAFTITSRDVPGTKDIVSTTYSNLAWDVEPGAHILLDDGNMELEVVEVSDTDVMTKVLVGGLLKEKKGINLPGSNLSIPALTNKDRADLIFGMEHGVDYIALSFVRREADVTDLRRAMQRINPARANTPVISKLEKPSALTYLDEIIEVSDGVMVARGDLGVELSPQKVPSAQKTIIQKANQKGKLVITATQMLESMVNNPRPTRAEASDVANAIFDGTDAVMLSAETASGKYPIEAVTMMAQIAEEAEANFTTWGHHHELDDDDQPTPVALARAARSLSETLGVAAVAVFTRTGSTARIISKERPTVPVLAFTPNPETYPRMALMWNVTPYLVPRATSLEEMLLEVEQTLMRRTGLSEGQQVVVIAGLPVARMGPANVVILHTIGQGARAYLPPM